MGNKNDSKRRRKGGSVGFTNRTFYGKRSTRSKDVLSLEEVVENTEDISPIISASHRKLSITMAICCRIFMLQQNILLHLVFLLVAVINFLHFTTCF